MTTPAAGEAERHALDWLVGRGERAQQLVVVLHSVSLVSAARTIASARAASPVRAGGVCQIAAVARDQ